MKGARHSIAVGYVRVSTDEQNLGSDAQHRAIERWALAHSVTIAAWHQDIGVSGAATIEERPGLQAALADIRRLRGGLLLVAKRDRLARDPLVAMLVERALATVGARVQTADGAGNGSTPADQLMRLILDGAAQFERAMIRERTRAALATKKAMGERVSFQVDFGFRLNPDGRTLEPHEGEQRILATIRNLVARSMSLRAITAELASRGFVGRAGRPLQLRCVHRLVQRLHATPSGTIAPERPVAYA